MVENRVIDPESEKGDGNTGGDGKAAIRGGMGKVLRSEL